MTKKQIKILIITFIIVALMVFLVFVLTNGNDKIKNDQPLVEEVNDNLNKEKIENEISKNVTNSVIEISEEDLLEMKIQSVAKNFAERYGTWSTDNKIDNFKSAKVYTTSRMENIIDNFILNNEKLADDYENYYGVTTKALNAKIIDSNETSANLNVSVQKIETLGDTSEQDTSYGILSLELIKDNIEWLVDYAEWE